jgi:hypothetical protein
MSEVAMAIVHAVGLPQNESERKAIAFFRDHLPGDDYLLFHSFELSSGKVPYEYDMVVIGPRGIYPMEVKGYAGRIRGNASHWEFENGGIIPSPLPLASHKARVLKSRLESDNPALRNIFVSPTLVILTHDKAQIELDDPEKWRVMRLSQVVEFILNDSGDSIAHYTDRICHALFRQFRPLRRENEIGDYIVLETISRNNLYSTFLARHKLIESSARFALKVYSLDLYTNAAEQLRQRQVILRDSRALYRLGDHPHIVRAHPPFPWESNRIVLPLDWVDGYSLRALLDSPASLSYPTKLDIARAVCEGLRFAHLHGVLHRDVRPDNVLVAREDKVKLINFDCARIEGDDLPTIASRIGRRLDERYVAPEVWQNPVNASRVSDIYATGILLFELLTGKTPYSKIREVFAKQGLPQKPTDLNPALPKDADELILAMCAYDPAKRLADLDQVIVFLELLK